MANLTLVKRQLQKQLAIIVEQSFNDSSLARLNPVTDTTLYLNNTSVRWREITSTSKVTLGVGAVNRHGLTATSDEEKTGLVTTFGTRVVWSEEDMQNPETSVAVTRNQRNAVRQIWAEIANYALNGNSGRGEAGLLDRTRSNIIQLPNTGAGSLTAATTFDQIETALRNIISSFQRVALVDSVNIRILVSQPIWEKLSRIDTTTRTTLLSTYPNVDVVYVPALGGKIKRHHGHWYSIQPISHSQYAMAVDRPSMDPKKWTLWTMRAFMLPTQQSK